MKLCKDCRFCELVSCFLICRYKFPYKEDDYYIEPASGKKELKIELQASSCQVCSINRQYDFLNFCGPDAKFFEPAVKSIKLKTSLLQKIKSWLN